jgi:hypothetical protein
MLAGNWKNFDELETYISYPELTAMVKAQREKDERLMKFQAALQGIDLDKKDAFEEDIVESMKREIRAEQMGVDASELKFKEEMDQAGFKIKVVD